MKGNLLIGIDVGTTATKVLVAEPIGKILASASADYPLLFPSVGWVEQDPLELFKGVKKAIKDALSQIPDRREEICAISLSTQRDTMVITDKNNNPLRNAITWMDSRAGEECQKLKDTFGEERVYSITGVPVSTIWTGAFILWIQAHEQEVFEKAACFGLVHDYIMCCFGAKEHFVDTTNACETMMYDFVNNCWSEELLSYMKLSADRLPKLVEPAQVIGTISPELAKELGLCDDVLLISGGGDQQCAMLGSGAVKPGDTELCIGTAANILAQLETPRFDENRKLICHRALVPETFVMEGAMLSTGKLIEWLNNVFYPNEDRKNFYLKLNYEVATNSHPGASGLLITPHFEGSASPHWNHDARGFCLGLTLSTNRADICRAILEGIALEIKKNLVLMQGMGIKANRIIVSGGASNSPVWLQIIADALGISVVTLENNECAAVGSVILAGVGSNIFRNIQHGVANMVEIEKVYMPRHEYTAMYDEMLEVNNNCYRALDENRLYIQDMQLMVKNSIFDE